MKFPWLAFIIVMIPITLGIWYVQHRRWQPQIDAADARLEQLDMQIEQAKKAAADAQARPTQR